MNIPKAAAAALVTLTVNGRSVKVPQGSTLLQAIRACGVHVPTLCYHPEFKAHATCRMCLVDVEGRSKPVAACHYPCEDNLKVTTDSPSIREFRKSDLQFILSRHPNECMRCENNNISIIKVHSFYIILRGSIGYYHGDDEKKVHIETGVTDGCAWVRVLDNGPGIAPEHLPHLFDRFYRADKARARVMEDESETPTGSGLGLSIIQWIVQAHGGEVHVESTPGNGSSFEVRFEAL